MTIGNITVTVGNATNPRATAVTYGSRTLKSATDLDLAGVVDGDTIVYQANTNSFVVEPAEAVIPDLYDNPIKINVIELAYHVSERFQEIMNAWLVEYEELNKNR